MKELNRRIRRAKQQRFDRLIGSICMWTIAICVLGALVVLVCAGHPEIDLGTTGMWFLLANLAFVVGGCVSVIRDLVRNERRGKKWKSIAKR